MVTTKSRHRDVVFRAIADPTRREILRLLRTGPQTVGELATNFPSSRPAISKHLQVLRTAGLVVTREEGAARLCRLNAKPLAAVGDWLRDYQAFWRASLHGLKRHVEASR